MNESLSSKLFEFRAFDKPAGVTTHRSQSADDPHFWGFAEYCGYRTQSSWQPVHRLDRETTGVVLMAGNQEAKRRLGMIFAAHDPRRASKVYLFVTDRAPKGESTQCGSVQKIDGGFHVSSLIEKQGKAFCSFAESESQPANAQTRFFFRGSDKANLFHLWEARPITGKPHQIRLHAEALGIPILGDREHNGSPFVRLMLHAQSLEINDSLLGRHKFESQVPSFFSNLDWLNDREKCSILNAVDRRRRLFNQGENECLRWLHTSEGELACDQFGSVLYFYWFGASAPGAQVFRRVELLCETLGYGDWFLRWMKNRGANQASSNQAPGLWSARPDLPTRWQAKESDLVFEFRSDSGCSPGLFLDQRQNRLWVFQQAKGGHVLNLFCYSGSFSVTAAHGGAVSVCSVDLSKTYLDWTRQNLRLNAFDDSEARFQFWAMDVREFFRRARKQNRHFDLIICDPPSFSRGPNGVFRIEQEVPILLREMAALLSDQGQILFCTNFERWSRLDFLSALEASAERLALQVLPAVPQDWDFELPGQEPVLKSAILKLNR